MYSRSLPRILAGFGLLSLLGAAAPALATDDTLPAASDRFEYLSRLEPYHYPARYIAAFETNSRQPFAGRESDTAGPLAKKATYASVQELQGVRSQILNDYGLLKLGYVWVVAISPETDAAGATRHYLDAMHNILGQFCRQDPEHPGSGATDGSGRYRFSSPCLAGDSSYLDVIADPIGDFSVLRRQHGGGTLVSWVIGQAVNLQADGIAAIRKRLPPGYYMVFADTIKNRLSGVDIRIVRVYRDGDERGYPMPLPPDIR